MQRIVWWGIIAVLGLSAFANAEDSRVPSEVDRNKAKPPSPAAATPINALVIDDHASKESLDAFRGAEASSTTYWLGLSCHPIDDTLRAQLGLEAGSGLVIRQVADNSPAITAGLQVHDIITQVTVGETTQKPANITQLTALVQQAETKPMTFLVLRGGKPLNVVVTPAFRKTVENSFKSGLSDYDSTLIYMQTPGQSNPFLFRMAGPVVALGGPPAVTANLPDDLTVVITKSGSQPVEIKIQQKDRGEWKLKEKETAVQPENVSQAVISTLTYLSQLVRRTGMDNGQPTFALEPGPQVNLGLGPVPIAINFNEPLIGSTPGTPANFPAPPHRQPPTLSSLQQRLDEIQKQQEQVTKTLDELRQSLQKSPPKN